LRLYRLSAAQNYAEGLYNLGVTYERGCVVPQDLNEAARLYRAAAAQHLSGAEKALRCLGYNS
jgi:TPR repeat protein